MMKNILITLLLTIFGQSIWAQQPTWNVTASNYQYSMNITGVIWFQGIESLDANDMVGAFVNGDCRGASTIQYEASLNRYYTFLTAYSNVVQGDSVEFIIYDASLNLTYNVELISVFEADAIIGTPNIPHIFSYPALNIGTSILSFSIPLETGSALINYNNATIRVEVNNAADITNLLPSYTLSNGANAYIGNSLQQSSVSYNNFSDTVVYNVIAENSVNSQLWSVIINYSLVGITESNTELDIKIYPNPANKNVNISVSNNCEIEVLSSIGSSIFKGNLNSSINNIDVSDYPSGIYLFKIKHNDKTIVKRVAVY